MARSLTTERPTRYQDFVAFCRRFDRDTLLLALARASTTWHGTSQDARGRLHPFLPWNVAGAAITVLCRGSTGGRRLTDDDLRRLCFLYSNLEHPGEPGDPDFATQLLARFLYQQWPFQRLDLKEWARPVALFEDTTFDPTYSPVVMREGWAETLLGCSVRDLVSVGFCLFAAAANGSHYPFDWDPGVQYVLEMHGGQERFDSIVRRNYLAELEDVKRERIAHVESLGGTEAARFKREPFAYSPLLSRPLIGGIQPGYWVAPCVQAIELKTSSLGIVYAGLEQWGEGFTTDAGRLFERYVGRNLDLISGAAVMPEIRYTEGRQELLSVDWIVVLPQAVLLIECKSMFPSRPIREGLENIGDGHRRLDKAIRQINRTVTEIRNRRSEFAGIPDDLPTVGLVVTLGNFDLGNDPEIRQPLTTAAVPTAIIGVNDLEGLVTIGEDELARLASSAGDHLSSPGVLEPRGWLEGTTMSANPILEAAFESVPAIARIAQERAGRGMDT